MGIKHLNRFLQNNCTTNAIRKTHLSEFKNKSVVIDTSIYLYKFITDNMLLENIYLFISVLKKYEITPIFIFDGKSPPEKQDLLIQRRLEKREAEMKYKELQTNIQGASSKEEKQEMLSEMENLKRQFVRVHDRDIVAVKELMDAYGICHYDADAEADQLCAYMVKTGKAWACISDDMDMFLYGCPFVIRHLSLMKHSVVLYDTTAILKELEMSEQQFCEIMVLSGTDYNINSKTSLSETMNWFYEYNKYYLNKKQIRGSPNQNEKQLGFYVWLVRNTKYIKDYLELLQVYQLFQLSAYPELEKWNTVTIIEMEMDIPRLQRIMTNEGFIFSSAK